MKREAQRGGSPSHALVRVHADDDADDDDGDGDEVVKQGRVTHD